MDKIKYIILSILLFSNILFGTDKLEKVSLQLHWKYQFEFAGFIAAKEKGFYEEVGLDVELKEYIDGIDIVDEILTEKSNYGVYNSNLLISHLENKPVRLMASIFKKSALVIITKPYIKNINDLVGKTIMAGTKKDFDLNFKYIFDENNIDPNNIKRILHTYDIQGFVDGKCDAMTAFISDQPYKLNKLGIEYNIIDPSTYGMYNLQLELFTSRLEKKIFPIRTKKFKEASIKGWKYALNNIDEVVDIIHKKYNRNISIEALRYEAKITKQLILPNIYNIGTIDDNFLKKQLEILQKDMNSTKNLDGFTGKCNNLLKCNLLLTNEEKDYLASHKTIKVQNEKFWAPFNFNEDNTPKGFSIDYINLIAKKLNINIEYISGYNWSQYMKMLQTKELDAMVNIAYTKQRAKSIEFTEPFYTIQNVIYVNKNNKKFNSLDELSGKTIATVKDYFTQQELAKNRPDIKQVIVSNQLETLKLLSLGKVDAVVAEKAIVDYIIQNNSISNITTTNFINKDTYIAKLRIGTSKDDIILKNIINKVQKSITTNEINLLKRKWFGIKTNTSSKLEQKQSKYLKNKKIKLCISTNSAPIEFYEDEKYQGITYDLINSFEEILNTKFQIIHTNSMKQSKEYLRLKRCDIIPHLPRDKKMNNYVKFTNSFNTLALVSISQNNDEYIMSLKKSISNKRIAIEHNSPLRQVLKNINNTVTFIDASTHKQMLDLINNDNADMTFLPVPIYSYYKNKYHLNNLKIAGQSPFKVEIMMAVRDDDKILLDIMNNAISKIAKSTVSLVCDKWTNVIFKTPINFNLVWNILILPLLVLSIVIFFLIKQKRLNNKITQLNLTLEDRIKAEVFKNRQKDKQIIEQSRLAQMGEMISMIAHQWRQPLAAISSTAGTLILKSRLNNLDKEDTLELSKNISGYSNHLSSTINDFRDFFKSNKGKQNISYDDLIKDVLNIVEDSIINKNIMIIKNLNSKMIFNTYSNEIKQVLLNLIKNAEDILIEKEIKNPTITISTNKNILIISDNGGGIPENIMNKIFDPYFSTKINKDGTGLGLYMSKTIIEEHCNGKLSASNDKDGAVFKIELGENNEES